MKNIFRGRWFEYLPRVLELYCTVVVQSNLFFFCTIWLFIWGGLPLWCPVDYDFPRRPWRRHPPAARVPWHAPLRWSLADSFCVLAPLMRSGKSEVLSVIRAKENFFLRIFSTSDAVQSGLCRQGLPWRLGINESVLSTKVRLSVNLPFPVGHRAAASS